MNSSLCTALLLTLAACGGGDSTANDGGTTDGTTSDVTASDTGNDATKPSKAFEGSVSFFESETGNTTSYTASAAFIATPEGGTSSTACTGTMVGSCCYVPPSQSDAGAPPTPVAAGAGGITIKDGAMTIATMTPTGTTYTPVSSATTTSLKWTAGDSLSVSAAGDMVDVFTGSVATSALFAGVMPALSIITPTAISRSSDFTITWTAATGAISVSLSALKAAVSDGIIVCTSTSDMGTMTIPKALLANFSATDTGFLSIGRTISADAPSANANVTLSSSTSTSGTATFN